MPAGLERELRAVRDTLLEEPVSPRVHDVAAINRHYCRYVAETVADRAADGDDLQVVEDGGQGYAHAWIRCRGRHYDAECIEGVEDHHDLPFFQRHPEAAIQVEPESADQAAVRNRGRRPLYPDL